MHTYLSLRGCKLNEFFSLQLAVRGKMCQQLKERPPWDGLEVKVVRDKMADGAENREITRQRNV